MSARWDRGVVVAFDGGPAGVHALEWAAATADRHGAPLLVRHVLDPSVAAARASTFDADYDAGRVVDHAMDVLAGFRPGGHEVSATVARGMLLPTLLAASRSADLLVLGRSGPGSPASFGGGTEGGVPSLSTEVCRGARGPVAVVPASSPGEPTGRVLVGIGDDDGAARALDVGFDEAQAGERFLTVLHVLEHAGALTSADGARYMRTWRWSAAAAVWERVERCAARHDPVEHGVLVRTGSAAEVLAAEVRPDDLLVLGRPAPAQRGTTAPPVVRHVLRSVRCPVVVAGAAR